MTRRVRERQGDAGVALLMVLVFMALFLSVAAGLVLMSVTETRIAGAERVRHELRGAAEVALERALQELARAADWDPILAGTVRSGFVDARGPPVVGEWGRLDLAALTMRLQRDADAANKWGPDGAVWRLFAYGSLDTLLSGTGTGSGGAVAGRAGADAAYTLAWVADDPDGDRNPSRDANQCVTVRAEAFGPFRSRQALVAVVRRRSAAGPGGAAATGLALISWRVPDDG